LVVRVRARRACDHPDGSKEYIWNFNPVSSLRAGRVFRLTHAEHSA
jgi:hypothetical protein